MSHTPSNRDPATPRWVKIFISIFIILILTVIAVHLAGFNFGGHLPHMPL